jgi:hypothetical protein
VENDRVKKVIWPTSNKLLIGGIQPLKKSEVLKASASLEET